MDADKRWFTLNKREKICVFCVYQRPKKTFNLLPIKSIATKIIKSYDVCMANIPVPRMILETESGCEIQNPSVNEIAKTIRDMPGGENSFVFLRKGTDSFIQVAGHEESGCLLEYWEKRQLTGSNRIFLPCDPLTIWMGRYTNRY